MRNAWRFANRLAPALLLVWGLPLVLYLGLTKLGQASDLMRLTSEDLVRHFFLTLALGAFSISSWAVLADAGRDLPAITEWVLRLVPCVLALPGPALIALGYRHIDTTESLTMGDVLLVVPGVLAPLGMAYFLTSPEQRGNVAFARATRFMATALMTACAGLYGLVFAFPRFLGLLLGPVSVLLVFASLALWTIWAVAIQAPLIGVVLLLLAGALAHSGNYGTRVVREIAPPTPAAVRLTAEQHAAGWLNARRGEIETRAAYPVFFITGDGGGIRAAYWTASVLGALADEAKLPDHTYLMSGVSGGSVGVTVVDALIADRSRVHGLQAAARAVFANDFLAAPLALFLTRDMWEGTFCADWHPYRFCAPRDNPMDRGIALENILEGAWRMTAGSDRLAEPFENLWANTGQWQVPALLLNATNAANGQARVSSNLAIGALLGDDADLLGRLTPEHTLRLSTAAVLGARFPVISPQGALTLHGTTEHLVDGGYFDNSGGGAALPVFRAFLAAATSVGLRHRILPVAVIVTNDAARVAKDPTTQARFCEAPAIEAESEGRGMAELVVAPVGTLDATRQNAAESRRDAFRQAVLAEGGKVIGMALFRCEGDFDVPLGWTLSNAVRDQIDGKIERLKQSAGPYREVLTLLRGSADAPATISSARER